MAKYYGPIGYATMVEVKPGVYKAQITERNAFGDVLNNSRSLQNSGDLNDNIKVANKISIVADPFANENFHAMEYVVYMGAKWKITDVKVEYPRLILTIGGVYNGSTT